MVRKKYFLDIIKNENIIYLDNILMSDSII